MYLSRIKCSWEDVIKKGINNDPYKWHKMTWGCFENIKDVHNIDGDRFILYSVYENKNFVEVYIQSKIKPVESKLGQIDIIKIPDCHLEHDKYIFKAILSPTYKKDGKSTRLYNYEDIEHWCIYKFQKSGVKLKNLIIQQVDKNKSFYKPDGNEVKYVQANIMGEIEKIDDRKKFKHSILNGIGPSKAWGCGLVLLKRI